MVEAPLFFEAIPLSLPRQQIYRRLGYREATTRLSAGRREEIEGYLEEALVLVRLRGVVRRLPVRVEGLERILLTEETVFKSKALAHFLRECQEVLLMGATAGDAVMEAIGADAAGRNVTRGVVLDAAASEMVDGALDWITDYAGTPLRREGRALLGRRFSAGYGDFALRHQEEMVRLLSMDRLGVRLTEHFVLLPEKSVTAITGIVAPPPVTH